MSLMNERPSSGAFLRSSVHLAQVGCGSSPGRANSFANAPSKTPLRSTKINHPTDLPASSFFSHSPATVGSAAWIGSAALVNATMLAMSSIEILVFKGAIPRCEAQPPSRNNMPISGRAGATQSACVTHRDGFRRNTAMVRKNLASNSDFTAFAAGPRPHELHCAPRGECPESGRLHASPGTPFPMPLIYRLASRNLLHDRLRFIATVIGIVFSVVLVTVQLGLYLGFGRIVTTMIDHASADLWIMPPGTKCFEDPSTLDERTRFQALSINGVVQAAPVVIGYAEWRIPAGGTFPVTPANKVTYFLVRVAPGADVESVRRRLTANLSDVDVLTTAEFRDRSRSFWLFGTGAGFALFAGALLGMIVGTVIVAQTLYSSTKDHINEFATLRAIGSSRLYIHKVIVCQALISAMIGFCLAAGIGLIVVAATADTALPIVMTPALTLVLFLLTLLMCVISAIAAILQVTRIDPVTVFTR